MNLSLRGYIMAPLDLSLPSMVPGLPPMPWPLPNPWRWLVLDGGRVVAHGEADDRDAAERAVVTWRPGEAP